MKQFITTWFFVLLISISFAQITGGGVDKQKQQEQAEAEAMAQQAEVKKVKPNRYKVNFITIATFKPKLELADPEVNYGIFNLSDGGKSGFMLEFGGMNFFTSDWGPDQTMNVGLYKSFAFGLQGYNWYAPNSETVDNASKSPFIYGEFKLGPAFTYNLSNDIAFDAFIKLGINISYGGTFETSGGIDDDYVRYAPSAAAVGFASGFGVNARIYRLLLNIEYDPGSLKYKYNADIATDSYEIEPRFKTSYMKFGIGYVIKNTR